MSWPLYFSLVLLEVVKMASVLLKTALFSSGCLFFSHINRLKEEISAVSCHRINTSGMQTHAHIISPDSCLVGRHASRPPKSAP